MKNQNDLIVSLVAAVIGIGAFCGLFFTKREPVTPPPPTVVPIDEAKPQEGAVTYAASLPSGSGNAGFGAPGGGGGRPAAAGAVGGKKGGPMMGN
jgi:hypothetical protein